MKRLFSFLVAALIFSCKISFAQISLEHVYDHGSTFVNDQLMLINFEQDGYRYVKVDRENQDIVIFDLNHFPVETIAVPNNLLNDTDGIDYIMYLSQNLFDDDPGIEYMLAVQNFNIPIQAPGHESIYIFDEDGTQLFYKDDQWPAVILSVPDQQFPIYNTPNGTKMILSGYSNSNDSAYVYSLPGTLSTAIGEVNNNYISDIGANKIFPNPTSSQATIEIQLSINDLPATLKIFDLNGNEVTEQKILAANNAIVISTLGLPAGIYYYQIENSDQVFTGKKFVVAH